MTRRARGARAQHGKLALGHSAPETHTLAHACICVRRFAWFSLAGFVGFTAKLDLSDHEHGKRLYKMR